MKRKLTDIRLASILWRQEGEPAVQGDERGYAMRLHHEITAEEAAEWQRGMLVDWANESYRIARDRIYGEKGRAQRRFTSQIKYMVGLAVRPLMQVNRGVCTDLPAS